MKLLCVSLGIAVLLVGCKKEDKLPQYTIPPDNDVPLKFTPTIFNGSWRISSILDNGIEYASLYSDVYIKFSGSGQFAGSGQITFRHISTDSLLSQRSWNISTDSMRLFIITNNEPQLISRFYGTWAVVQIPGPALRIKEYKNGVVSKHITLARDPVLK